MPVSSAHRIVLVLAIGSTTAAVACSSSSHGATGPSTGGTATGITKVSGDSQVAEWNAVLPKPLVVKVADSVGNPVTNTPVAWLTSLSYTAQMQNVSTTNASGETQLAPMLGGMPGPFTVSAAINGHSVTFSGSAAIQLAAGQADLTSSILANCGITKRGAAFCWGSGSYGQLGDGDTASMHTGAVPVSGGYTFTQVSMGDWMGCGIVTGGALYCWGNTGYTTLGNGTGPGGAVSYAPLAAGNGRKFSQISVGLDWVCGISGGAAYCWGTNNNNGTLGNGTTTSSFAPTPVSTPGGVTLASVGVGFGFACALSTTGAAYCWGSNSYDALGTGSSSPDSSLVPIPVTGGRVFQSLAVGSLSACGVTSAGVAYCWGTGTNGNGTHSNEYAPTAVQQSGLTFTQLSLTSITACALTGSGAAYCWGDNSVGELGTGSLSTSGLTPVAVTGGLTFSTISAGGLVTCGITTTSTTYCWGSNGSGQLGFPTTVDSLATTPQMVPGMGGIT